MYKLMIVDDEQIVIDAVTHIINKNIRDVEIAACAKNGRDAIEKARAVHPEIILMDIRMPGINGIDAIAEIQKFYPDIKFAIISAYEQFEFAKQAMEFGVEHYILKPINRTVLINTINKMTHQIRQQKEEKKKELEIKEKLEKVIPYMEQGFIYSILLNTEFDEELARYMEILDIGYSGGYIMVMQFGDGDKASGLSNRIGSSIVGHENYPYVRDIFKFKCNCIVGPVLVNKIIVYVPCEEFRDEYEFRLQTIELAEDILNSIRRKMKMEYFIGIGGYKRNHDIIHSYNEAVKALRHNRGEPISHILDICGEQPGYAYDIQAAGNMVAKIEMGDSEGAAAVFAKIADRIDGLTGLGFDIKKNLLIEYMVIVHRTAMEAKVEEDSCLKYNDYIQEMLSHDSIEKLTSWCINRIKHITGKIRSKESEKGSGIICRAKKYIRDNFKDEITLEELSRKMNISPQYFSRLFKEETGYNFIEYLTFVRIEHSKILLTTTNMTVKEICYNVGYGDPNYFSRLFKKNTGMSPTVYVGNNR
ncbi:MAG TPA: hypothetical protein DCE11_01795 [Ruminiclostridium sp.]|jgi:two-component system response regulator YesN|nr:hypothetical protein [Ruminiclostridium sp.]